MIRGAAFQAVSGVCAICQLEKDVDKGAADAVSALAGDCILKGGGALNAGRGATIVGLPGGCEDWSCRGGAIFHDGTETGVWIGAAGVMTGAGATATGVRGAGDGGASEDGLPAATGLGSAGAG